MSNGVPPPRTLESLARGLIRVKDKVIDLERT
jgi:hypothetical protein